MQADRLSRICGCQRSRSRQVSGLPDTNRWPMSRPVHGLDATSGRNLCSPDTQEMMPMPARLVHVVLAVATPPFSLATGTNAGLRNTNEVKALQQVPCQGSG